MNTILQDIVEHHIWVNDTLLGYCETLSPEDLELTVPGTFGGIEATLVHLAANEEHYLQIIDTCGGTTGIRSTIFNGDVPRALASVRSVLAKAGDAWRAVVRNWPDNLVLDVPWEGQIEQLQLSVLVAQVIDHGVEHRTHIRTILATHGLAQPDEDGVTAPNIDGWSWDQFRKGQ